MKRMTRQAGAVALATMLGFTLMGAAASGAFAQETDDSVAPGEQTAGAAAEQPAGEGTTEDGVRFVSQEVVQPLPRDGQDSAHAPIAATSLAELVATIPTDGEMSNDMQCLASAIYFESRGEPLDGQLAVGQVVINRAESGRFPTSYCGVVYQPSQFSFVRGGRMPAINTASEAWHNAQAIARIAHEGLWQSPAEGALFFHASHVRPGWHLTQVARVSRHVFYR
jgi:spore germination cell wall hydrolase CwlJ-like protein